jgi:hypothetical protein
MENEDAILITLSILVRREKITRTRQDFNFWKRDKGGTSDERVERTTVHSLHLGLKECLAYTTK